MSGRERMERESGELNAKPSTPDTAETTGVTLSKKAMEHLRSTPVLLAYVASLEADSRRLDVLEESLACDNLTVSSAWRFPIMVSDRIDTNQFKTLREAADAEILRRSNTGDTT